MTLAELSAPASAPRRSIASRPGLAERWFAFATVFVLAVGFPFEWFLNQANDTGDTRGGSTIVVALSSVMLGLLLFNLNGNWRIVIRQLELEPLLITFVGMILLSTTWSGAPDVTLRRGVALLLTTLFGVYLVNRFEMAEIIRMVAVALAVATVLNYIWVFALPSYGLQGSLWSGITPSKNSLGRLTVLAILTFWFAARVSPRFRVFYWAMGLLNVGLLMGTRSTTSQVGMLLLAGLVIIYRSFRARKTLFGAVILSLSGSMISLMLAVTVFLEQAAALVGKDVSLTGRTTIWPLVIREALDEPILGHGYSAFWLGWFSPAHDVWLDLPNNTQILHAHNFFLEILLQLGAVGLVIYAALYSRTLVRSIRHLRRVPGEAGLWPLTYLSYAMLYSLTEAGILGRSLLWALFVVAIVRVSGERTERRRLLEGAWFPKPRSVAIEDHST